MATLHTRGHISTVHIDDCYLQGKTYKQCIENVIDSVILFDSLGFVVHPTKSILVPKQEIVTLGFLINSIQMTIQFTRDKAIGLKLDCEALLNPDKPKLIREVARVIGKIVASFPGVMYGPLYYRYLEWDKSQALKKEKGNFNAYMVLSPKAKSELHWWVSNVEGAYQTLDREAPQVQIFTDASLSGWGAECQGKSTGGQWTEAESKKHINYLEMFAIYLGLKTFASKKENMHIRIMCDNTSAVNILNHMGTSHSDPCNELAKIIWEWCMNRNIWISVAHIPGKSNIVADFESCRNQRESEWMLNKTSLSEALKRLKMSPVIDRFASICKQFQRYVSYRPDPDAEAIDAFSLNWENLNFYAFPPFSVIPTVLDKIQKERAEGIVVLPDWPTQSWYTKASKLMKQPSVQLKLNKTLLILPTHLNEIHPLWRKINLRVCHLSGKV